jgi:hypothetical protein
MQALDNTPADYIARLHQKIIGVRQAAAYGPMSDIRAEAANAWLEAAVAVEAMWMALGATETAGEHIDPTTYSHIGSAARSLCMASVCASLDL